MLDPVVVCKLVRINALQMMDLRYSEGVSGWIMTILCPDFVDSWVKKKLTKMNSVTQKPQGLSSLAPRMELKHILDCVLFLKNSFLGKINFLKGGSEQTLIR
jgi:hypothetical protein